MMIITQALIWPYLYYVTIPMVGTASSNPMLYQLEGVNGKDLKVKAHPGQRYAMGYRVWGKNSIKKSLILLDN